MGAYENPAMIIDKSAEILTQGFMQASEAINKGILAMGQGLGEKGKAEEKRRQELQDQKNTYISKNAAVILEKVNDQKTTLTEKRADDQKFDQDITDLVTEYGPEYAEAKAMETWPLATKEEKEAASIIVKKFEYKLGGYLSIGQNENVAKNYFNENKNNTDFVIYGKNPQEVAINRAYIDFETGSSNMDVTQEYDSENQKKITTFTVEDTPENRQLYGEDNLSETEDGKLQFKKTVGYDNDYSGFLLVKKADLRKKAEALVTQNLIDPKTSELNENIQQVTKEVYDDGAVAVTTNRTIINQTLAEAELRPAIKDYVQAYFDGADNSMDNAQNILALKTSLKQDFNYTQEELDQIDINSNVNNITERIIEKALARQIPLNSKEVIQDGIKYQVSETKDTVWKKPTSEDQFKATMRAYYKDLSKIEDGTVIRSHRDNTMFKYYGSDKGFRRVITYTIPGSSIPQVDSEQTNAGTVYKDYATLMLGMGLGE